MLVASLRRSAATLQKTIDQKRNPAVAQQRVTERRARQINTMATEADRLERVQTALRVLADAHESETCPPELRALTTRAMVEHLALSVKMPVPHLHPTLHQRLVQAGVTTGNYSQVRQVLLDLMKGELPQQDFTQRRIQELTRKVIIQPPELWFPTPTPLAHRLVEMADIQPGHVVLEPSAGIGHIADVIQARYPDNKLLLCEWYMSLNKVLRLKDYHVVANDFLCWTERQVDRIVANFPFQSGADIEHIQHAYSLLNPGGRIVAIMGEGGFFREDRQSTGFRQWFDKVEGQSEKLPDGSFADADRATGVAARVVVVERGL